MLKHVFLFDATRHIGLAQSLLGSAQTYTSQFQPEVVEWFVRAPQAQAFRTGGADVHVVTAATSWPPIESRIRELAANGSADCNFHVLSYDPVVVRSAAGLNDPQLAISALSLTALAGKFPDRKLATITAQSTSVSPGSSTPDLAEAIAITKRVLGRRRAMSPDTAVKQSYLRRLLVDEDIRFTLNPADFASRTLISDVVNDGVRNGWLQRFKLDNKSGTERIYLAVSSVPALTEPPQAPTLLNTAQANGHEPVTEPAAENKQKDIGRERTSEMINTLKHRRIYSGKQIRDYVFRALRSATEQPNLIPLSASQLVRQVCSSAEGQAKSDGVSFEYWYAASDASFEMMLHAGILLDEHGKPIPPGIGSRGTKVCSIAPDFEDRCEMFLLEYLIKTLGNVTSHDRTALAHALFKVAPDKKSIYDMQDRVDELLVKLQDRISESDDGTFVVDKCTLAAVS